MTSSLRQATLVQLLDAAGAITADVEQCFGVLNTEQLRWQPQPHEWSVGQCLEHLVISNSLYFGMFQASIDQTRRPTFWERLPWLPALFGPQLIRSLEPDAPQRMQAPPIFRPTPDATRAGTVADFLAMQRTLVELMRASAALDLDAIIVTSPVAVFVTYTMLDAYRIIVTHERLHIAQARRVLNAPDFPAAVGMSSATLAA